MSDGLDAAVRAKLVGFSNDACLGGCGCEESRCGVYGFDEMRAVLVAVLDRHKPQRLDDEHDPYCTECSGLHGVPVTYPCRTIRDIARALGIEANDD